MAYQIGEFVRIVSGDKEVLPEEIIGAVVEIADIEADEDVTIYVIEADEDELFLDEGQIEPVGNDDESLIAPADGTD